MGDSFDKAAGADTTLRSSDGQSNDNNSGSLAVRKIGRKAGSDPIGEALKRFHDGIAAEHLPDGFADLVAQIDAKITGSSK